MVTCIIISGSSSGVGRACAELFLENGLNVIGLDLEDTVINASGYTHIKMDVSNFSEYSKVINIIKEKKFLIETVVNNAAVQVEKSLLETTEEEWDRVMSVNLKSVFLSTKSLIGHFAEHASIINISSVHSRATSSGLAAYVASKGAISSLSRAMSIELGNRNIRVNSVHPGAINTPMLQKGLSRSGDAIEASRKLASSSPLNRIGEPIDVANLVSFISNNKLAKNITGQEFYCDSGVLAKLASE